MAEEKAPRVRSLIGFLKWAARFEDGQYLFRGVSNDDYEIQASASRRLNEEDRNPVQLLKVNQDLIVEARLLGHDRQGGHQLSDLELLAQLQHFGAATCLIDFTRNTLVALWMACQQSTEPKNANGKVFAVRSGNLSQFRNVTPKLLRDENIEFFFKKEDRGFPLYQWQPKYQNNRIIAQQSVFVFGGADIPVEGDCIILAGGKNDILTSLDKRSGITEASLFPDFDGFARLHAWHKPYIAAEAEQTVQRGTAVPQEEELADAPISMDASLLSETSSRSSQKGEAE